MSHVYKLNVTAEQSRNQIKEAQDAAAFATLREQISNEELARTNADAAINLQLTSLQNNLADEITARTNADNIFTGDLNTEINQRTAAVTNLQNDLQTEITNRQSAETTLRDDFNNAIDDERTARSQEIADVQAAILAAMGNAAAAEAIENEKLRQQIISESENQSSTTLALSNKLDSEIALRQNDTTTLTNNLQREATTRATDDTALRNELDDLRAEFSQWKLDVSKLPKPIATNTNFNFDGTQKNLVVLNFDSRYMIESGTLSATAAGDYQVSYSLKNPDASSWNDGSSDTVVINWQIKMNVLTAEQSTGFEQVGTLTYNGAAQSVTIKNYDENYHVLTSDTSKINAGNYTAQISPKNGCMWNDSTTAVKNIPWQIQKVTAAIPVATDTIFEYDGTAKTLQVRNYDAAIMTQEGTITATDSGDYQVSYSLKDKNNYQWAGGGVDDVVINWQLGSRKLTKPTLNATSFTYTGDSKSVEIRNFNEDYMTKSGSETAVDAATYSITIQLKNPARAKWADDSDGDIILNWTIKPAKLSAEQSTFTNPENLTFAANYYGGIVQSLNLPNYDANYHVLSGVTTSSDAGTFTAYVEPAPNYVWSNNRTTKKKITWTIDKLILANPVASGDTEVEFDNKFHIFECTYRQEYMNLQWTYPNGTNTFRIAGDYILTVSLKFPASTTWEDLSTADVTLTYKINHKHLTFEQSTLAQDGILIFAGMLQAPAITNYDRTYHLLGGVTSSVNAGTYTMLISPQPNYCWYDGTFDTKEVVWVMERLKIEKPYAITTEFDYDGESHSLQIVNYNSAYMTKSGAETATAAGNYTLTFKLANKNNAQNYAWADSSTDDLVINWSIGLIKLATPNLTAYNFSYDGNPKNPTYSGFQSEYMEVGGDTSATNAGDYVLTFTLKDTSIYAWADGSTAPLSFYWTINRQKLSERYSTISQYGTLNYNGSLQTLSLNNFDANYHSLGGIYAAQNAGEYVAKVSPLNNYCWNDGTFDAKEIVWAINPIKIAKPTLDGQTLTNNYSGTPIYFYASNYNADYITFSGVEQATAPGVYPHVYKLKDKTNTTWADDSTGDVTFVFEIKWLVFDIPKLVSETVEFGGSYEIDYGDTPKNYLSMGFISSSGDYILTVGEHTTTVHIIKTEGVIWKDGTQNDITLTFEVIPARLSAEISNPYQITIPTYTGNAIAINNSTYLGERFSGNVDFSGDYQATDAGEYTALITPKANFAWQDGTTSQKSIKWKINPAIISPPAIDTSVILTYDGNSKSPTLINFDANKMVLSGDVSEINAGDYILTVGTTSNFYFADAETVNLNWTINKKEISFPSWTNAESAVLLVTGTNNSNLIATYDGNHFNPVTNLVYDSDTCTISGYFTNMSTSLSAPPDSVTHELFVTPKQNYTFSGTNYAGGKSYTMTWIFQKRYLTLSKLGSNYSYNGQERSGSVLLGTDGQFVSISGTQKATEIGNYEYTMTILSTHQGKCVFVYNGQILNTNSITINWSISDAALTVPTLAQDYFDYDGAAKTVTIQNFNSTYMTKSGTESATNRGFYSVKISLTNNASWASGGNADVILNWAVGIKKVAKPTISGATEFTYDGNAKTVTVANLDTDSVNQTGYLSATDAATYNITFALKNTTNFIWEDSTTAAVTYSWKINKAYLTETQSNFVQNGSLYFTGSPLTVSIRNYNANLHDLSGVTNATAAGTYTAKIAPKANYLFNDGTSAAKNVSWKIQPKTLAKPTAETLAFAYDGNSKTLNLSNFDTNYINQSGTISAVDSGSYQAVFSLKDTVSTKWQDGTSAAVTIDWSIGGNYITKPTLSPVRQFSTGLHNGHSVTIQNFDAATMTKSGIETTQSTANPGAAAEYTITISLKDKVNTAWVGNTTADLTLHWIIDRYALSEAESTLFQDKAITYDGNVHTAFEACSALNDIYAIEYYQIYYTNAAHTTFQAESTAVNAGTYYVAVKVNSAAKWSDGSTGYKYFSFVIDKAVPTVDFLDAAGVSIPVSWGGQKVTISGENKTAAVTFSTPSNGAVSFSIANSDICAATYNSSSKQITFTAKNNGNTYVTVNQAEGTNYAAVSKKIVVLTTRNLDGLSWTEIYNYAVAGTLDKYSTIGGSKVLAINGAVGSITINDNYRAVLIGYQHNTGYEGKNCAHFAVMKNADGKNICFVDSSYGQVVSDDTPVFHMSTNESGKPAHTTILNAQKTEFLNALPAELQNVICDRMKYACGMYEGGQNYRLGRIWQLSPYEIDGRTTENIPYQKQAQYEYFANGNSKICYRHDDLNTAAAWWTREWCSAGQYYVKNNGAVGTAAANISYGVVFCFSIGESDWQSGSR